MRFAQVWRAGRGWEDEPWAASTTSICRSSSRKEEDRALGCAARAWRSCASRSVGSSAPGLGPGLCVLFEGWDASGKGGAIKRLVGPLDPRHVRVAQFAAPTSTRSATTSCTASSRAAGLGGMAVLDRTWYGRVLVERVEGFATEEEWRRAYDEIDDFEGMLAEEGMIIVKLWLHISEDEQLKRFERRRERSAEGVEAHRRGLAQPREARGLRGGGRGHVRAHRHRPGAVADRPGRVQALRARARHAGGHRGHRGGLRAQRLPAAGAARGRETGGAPTTAQRRRAKRPPAWPGARA